jgi:septum formation protein
MLILASQSPRRSHLLTAAGIPHQVRPAHVPEVRHASESPLDYVFRLSRDKAVAVRQTGEIALGADTIVVVDDEVLEKPSDPDHARRMLESLSGRGHRVLTGFCLASDDVLIQDHAETVVHVAPLSPAEVDAYLATPEPYDKAGAYAIQGLFSRFITRIDGDYPNVVGLPIARVYQHLTQLRPAYFTSTKSTPHDESIPGRPSNTSNVLAGG